MAAEGGWAQHTGGCGCSGSQREMYSWAESLGKLPGLLLHGAGETPPPTRTGSLPHLLTPPFSEGFVVEASVRSTHVRKNRVEHHASYACPLRSPGTLSHFPCSPCWQFRRFKAPVRKAKSASSLGEEEHLVERQSKHEHCRSSPM